MRIRLYLTTFVMVIAVLFSMTASEAVADTIPPTIIATNPPVGATDVPVEIDYTIEFSEPMDEQSVLNTKVTLTDLTTGEEFADALIQELVDIGLIEASFNPEGTILTLTSQIILEPNHTYQIFLTDIQATDLAGNLLTIDQSLFEFTTQNITPLLPHAFVLLAEKKVKVHGQVLSEGDIHSNDKIDFKKGNPSRHTGDLTAASNIKIDKDNTIEGNVTAGGDVDLKGNATAITVTENAVVSPVPLPILSFSAGGDNVKVKKNQSRNLEPGFYGKVKVDKGGMLQLSSGEYSFEELDLKDDTTLDIDVGNGTVTINTVKKLHFHKRCQVVISNAPDGSGSRFVTFNSLKKVDVHEGARVLGSIIAPSDKVHLKKNVSFQGAICAKEINIDKGSIFLHHDSPAPLPAPPLHVRVPDVQAAIEVQEIQVTTPTRFELNQNYPNPFNPETWIPYRLAEAADVSLTIYDMTGSAVRQIEVGHRTPAVYTSKDKAIYWDGRNDAGERVSSGVYFYDLKAGHFSATRKMTILK